MKLISMTDYVLEQSKIWVSKVEREYDLEFVVKITKYANFLKQPLTLGMFVPCDEDGNVLEEPKCMYIYMTQCFECSADEMYRCRKFLEAKERVLFDCGVKIDTSDYRSTKRMLIDLNCKGGFRIFNRHIYHNGEIEEKFLPNFSEIPTIEYLINYNLTLTPTAIKQIGL